MNLIRVTAVVASFLAALCINSSAVLSQTVASTAPTNIRPFVTFAIGPAGSNSRQRGSRAVPVPEVVIGARKRVSERFGVALSAFAGKTINEDVGGSDLACPIRINDPRVTGCLPAVPLLDWIGASIGGEIYPGRAILGLHAGAGTFGTKEYERYPATSTDPLRAFGTRVQFEAVLPVYRALAISLSAAHRPVPSLVGDRMRVSSFGAGIALR